MQPQPLFLIERAARQPVGGEPAHRSQEGVGAREVETDYGVGAALEAEMAAAAQWMADKAQEMYVARAKHCSLCNRNCTK